MPARERRRESDRFPCRRACRAGGSDGSRESRDVYLNTLGKSYTFAIESSSNQNNNNIGMNDKESALYAHDVFFLFL